MGPWVMCRRWNLQESMWQNSKKNHLMIDPKTGYTSWPRELSVLPRPKSGAYKTIPGKAYVTET